MANHTDFMIMISGANGFAAIEAAFQDFTKFDADDLQIVGGNDHEHIFEIVDEPWHDCRDELAAISEEYPEWDIRIQAKPEAGDPWHARAKGGNYKQKSAVITFPEITDEELEG